MGALTGAANAGLRDDLLLEVRFPDTGVAYRIARDGRYLVVDPDGAEQQRAPDSELEPGSQVLTQTALERLTDALAQDGFFGLPERVPTVAPDPSEGIVLPNSGTPPRPRPIVVSARDGSGRVHSVAGSGDPRAPWTYGRLSYVYEAIDREAIGGWMRE